MRVFFLTVFYSELNTGSLFDALEFYLISAGTTNSRHRSLSILLNKLNDCNFRPRDRKSTRLNSSHALEFFMVSAETTNSRHRSLSILLN